MLAAERQRRILALLQDRDLIPVEKLRQELPVSHMTIWRDLKTLEKEGLVRHVRGGVAREDYSPHPERGVGQKEVVNRSQKEAIAACAVSRFVQPGHTLCLEGGTTVMATIPLLTHENLTVLTNSLEVVNRIWQSNQSINLMSSGGIVREISGTFYGPTTASFFREFSPDILFLGGCGFTVEHGLNDTTPVEIQAKQAMIQSAKLVVALLDSSKFGVRSLMHACDISQIDVLITDDGVNQETGNAIRDAGLDVTIVPVFDKHENIPIQSDDSTTTQHKEAKEEAPAEEGR